MKRLIVLRPEPGASATLEAARGLGLTAISIPLFTVEPLGWDAPEAAGFDGLLLTSANALRHAGDSLRQLRGLTAYCVGRTTAEEARNAGFDVAAVGTAGVDRLLGSIESGKRLLHLAGEHRTQLEGVDRHRITVISVYRATELPPPAGLAQANGSVVALHSPRAARRFANLAATAGLDRSTIALAAISRPALGEAGRGWLESAAADTPDDPSLLALARSMCNKPARS